MACYMVTFTFYPVPDRASRTVAFFPGKNVPVPIRKEAWWKTEIADYREAEQMICSCRERTPDTSRKSDYNTAL
jgi:hypothetical protein